MHKLAILEQYAPRFTAKTGSRWGRVVLVDGFAGTGHLGDAPGSASLLAATADGLRSTTPTTVLLYEKDKANYKQLRDVEAGFKRRGLDVRATQDDVAQHIGSILDEARGATLLLFLDPCGALLPFSTIVGAINDRRRLDAGGRRIPTEALLNFSAGLVRRVGGAWVKHQEDASGVARLTAVCGGEWWKPVVYRHGPAGGEPDYRKVTEVVAREYGKRMAAATGSKQIVVPVTDQVWHQPIYHLVFITGSNFGLEAFYDGLGNARPAFFAATPPPTAVNELDLWADQARPASDATASESRRNEALHQQRQATDAVEANIRRIARQTPRFALLDHIEDAYAGVEGVATRKQLGSAIKALIAAGELVLVRNHRDLVRRVYEVAPSEAQP